MGEEGGAIVGELFETYHAHVREGKAFSTLSRRISPLRLRMYSLVVRGAKNPDEKASKLCKDLLTYFPCLWTFARVEGVPPTNNLAERRLRPAVLWRKNSFGSHSAAGSRFAERMMTIAQTLRLRGAGVLHALERAIRGDRSCALVGA